ncbi:hypothetical protein Hesp01_74370 [Herbidospora sp. NBRC 101105]|nr:hypothetical protein Hesp01_74370 [Herbidospora sp. NBRC 101105]
MVATEYEGLGTPGPHPYLHGASEAYGVIDMVRAARSAGDVYDVDAAERERLTRLMEYDADIPIVDHSTPAGPVQPGPARPRASSPLSLDAVSRSHPCADAVLPLSSVRPRRMRAAAPQQGVRVQATKWHDLVITVPACACASEIRISACAHRAGTSCRTQSD